MPRHYRDAALIEEATRLYVQEGLTIAEIALRLPVAERTLQEWSRKYNWVKRRKQYLLQNEELQALVTKLQLRLARMLLEEDFDPQEVYALARGISVLKPSSQERLREIEKLEAEGAELSAEEKIRRLAEFLRGYGIEPPEER